MRMHNQTESLRADQSELKKVHPQLRRNKECGCIIRQDLDRANGLKEKKRIRNCREAKNADAKSDQIQETRKK